MVVANRDFNEIYWYLCSDESMKKRPIRPRCQITLFHPSRRTGNFLKLCLKFHTVCLLKLARNKGNHGSEAKKCDVLGVGRPGQCVFEWHAIPLVAYAKPSLGPVGAILGVFPRCHYRKSSLPFILTLLAKLTTFL